MVVTGLRASQAELAPPCKHMRCYRALPGPARPHRGGAYLPVRVASDRDLEDAGAPASESRMAEEPRAVGGLCVRKLVETTLVTCLGEAGKGETVTMFCATSHAAALVVDFAQTARQHVRAGFLVAWRNIFEAARRLLCSW